MQKSQCNTNLIWEPVKYFRLQWNILSSVLSDFKIESHITGYELYVSAGYEYRLTQLAVFCRLNMFMYDKSIKKILMEAAQKERNFFKWKGGSCKGNEMSECEETFVYSLNKLHFSSQEAFISLYCKIVVVHNCISRR